MDYGKVIFDTARGDGMPALLANFIAAQSRHETNDFRSNVFLACNNAVGYKYVGQALPAKRCTNAPEGGSYASYPSIVDSIHELTAWIRRRQREGEFPADLRSITTPEKYSQLLKDAGYYGDPVSIYANGLRRFATDYGAPIAFGTVAIIGFALLLYSRHKKSR